MAQPRPKSPAIESLLSTMSGDNRAQAIRENRCINPPFGCGGQAAEFRSPLDEQEYTISGLCQACQDKVFKDIPD